MIKFQERLPFQYALSHSVNVEGTENLVRACAAAGVSLEFRLHLGYDHSYYFISTFIADHIAYHAKALKA